jgi:HEAT repeat protein
LGLPAFGWTQKQTSRQVPVDSLIFDLKNPDAVRRKDAATQLGLNKIERAVPDLVAAAGDPVPDVRREIVVALDRILDARALPAFSKLSADPEKDIRDKSIHGILNLYLPPEKGIGATFNKMANFLNPWSDEWDQVVVEPGIVADPTAIAALRGRLQDQDEGLRIKAARALGILKGRDAIPSLLESLRNDSSNAVRFESVRALRKIGDPAVSKDVLGFVSYNDSKTRNESVYTVGRFRWAPAVNELTRLFEQEAAPAGKKPDRTYLNALIDALAFIADPSSKELFLKEVKSGDETVRLRAMEGLARIGDASMVTDISRDRMNEKDPKMRTAQAYALYRMGRKEYLDEVVKALGNRKTSQEARQYLAETRPEEMPDLYLQVKNDDPGIRESLAEILGLIGDNRAIPVLQELSQDHRGQIAALSNQAIRRISARTGTN